MANFRHIWLFGDDDKMNSDAIRVVLSLIENDYDLILANYSIWLNNFTVLKSRYGLPVRKKLKINDHNDVLRQFGINLGYISSVIMKKDLFLSVPEPELEPHFEYGFPHLFSAYSGIAKRNNFYYLSQPVFCNRFDNSMVIDDPIIEKSKNIKVFFVAPAMIFDALKMKGYSSKAVAEAKRHILKKNIARYLFYRKRKGWSMKGLLPLLSGNYRENWLLLDICKLIIFMPDFLPKMLEKIISGVKKKAK
jgi:hypothetical protein